MSKENKESNVVEYKVLAFDAKKTAIERINKSGSNPILKIVEEHEETAEIDRRVTVIKKAITRYHELKKEIDGIKPDIKGSFTVAGVQGSATYSEAVWNSKLAKIKDINLIVEAVEAYTKDNDFSKLDKVIK